MLSLQAHRLAAQLVSKVVHHQQDTPSGKGDDSNQRSWSGVLTWRAAHGNSQTDRLTMATGDGSPRVPNLWSERPMRYLMRVSMFMIGEDSGGRS